MQREYLQREIEKRFIRMEPLGKDRNYNRYWFFRRDGRIFVESCDSKQWGYYSTKEEVFILHTLRTTHGIRCLVCECNYNLSDILEQLDALKGSLNRKGVRERALQNQLEKSYNKIWLVHTCRLLYYYTSTEFFFIFA